MDSSYLQDIQAFLLNDENPLVSIIAIGTAIVLLLLFMLKLNFIMMRKIDQKKLDDFHTHETLKD